MDILIKVGFFAIVISIGFFVKNWFHTMRMKRDGYVVITTETSETDNSNPYKKYGY
jgi:hypothetical protein